MTFNYAVFILSHGRANNPITYKTLIQQGYTGRIYFIVDDEDKQLSLYQSNFGAENVLVFNKAEVLSRTDTADITGTTKIVLAARNTCFDFARKLGLEYFLEFDDDYQNFGYRYILPEGKLKYKSVHCALDEIFNEYLRFLSSSCHFYCLAMTQGGDNVCDIKSFNYHQCHRKAMNTLFCKTDRRFNFVGRLNEDVTNYVLNNQIGNIMMALANIQITQPSTQQNSGGATDAYLAAGTYQKSFYSVIFAPSCVKIGTVGTTHPRVHHKIDWDACAVKIISDRYRKRPCLVQR